MKHMGRNKGVCPSDYGRGKDGSETKKKIRKSEKTTARQKSKVDMVKVLKQIEDIK